MTQFHYNLLELNVDKLFQEHHVEDVIEIEKLLEAEIERKRVELRGMVGDHYKDILVASDAIKTMKSFSEGIVTKIGDIQQRCEKLMAEPTIYTAKPSTNVDSQKIEERSIIVQIRLIMVINNQIWSHLDDCNYIKAVELCLLAQYIHTGLQLLPQENLKRLPILKQMKSDIDALRTRILKKIKDKLQTIELDSQETSANLIALMLLKGLSTQSLDIFMDLRKRALHDVINQSYNSVRLQITAMMKCLIATVRLLHDCFISWRGREMGLIWIQLEEIVGPNAPLTLTKVELPSTPLLIYIPEILKQYRPKLTYSKCDSDVLKTTITNWLQTTSEIIREGIDESLTLVTNLRGLYIIREEVLRLKFADNWATICEQVLLPKKFHLWSYFFQSLITERAKQIARKKVEDNLKHVQDAIADSLKHVQSEKNLKSHVWIEQSSDVSQSENKHLDLSMKTKGYSSNLVKLCTTIDGKYLELLQDFSLYAYGTEYEVKSNENAIRIIGENEKFVDRIELEKFLGKQCVASLHELKTWLLNSIAQAHDEEDFILKSVFLARFLQAIGSLCPHVVRCCIHSNEWHTIVTNLAATSLNLWQNWLNKRIEHVKLLAETHISCSTISEMFAILPKWDTIEIQEEGEEKTFTSRIRVPFQLNLGLQQVLHDINSIFDDVIPHTVPKNVHLHLIEAVARAILTRYEHLTTLAPNQTLALQLLFDVKFTTIFCVPKENLQLIAMSQSICDGLRARVDPFDLDVFYSHLQANVKHCALQQQMILGSLLPNTSQLNALGVVEKSRAQEVDPSVLGVNPTSCAWFQLLPIPSQVQRSAPVHQVSTQSSTKNDDSKADKGYKKLSTLQPVRSGAADFFGAVTNNWFS